MQTDVQAPSRPLVGRSAELAELDGALDRVTSGMQWFVRITGEPGIGKSSLLRELMRRARERGWLVLSGRAAEFEQDLPFAVLRDAVEDHFAAMHESVLRAFDAHTLAELAAVFPSLRSVVNVPVPAGVPSDRYTTHRAIRALLETLARRQPVAVVLDDVHWADAASVEMIAYLLRRIDRPMLFAMALRRRSPKLSVVLDAATRTDFGTPIELSPLTSSDAEMLMDPTLDAQARAVLYRQSGGNPFYLQQLARAATPPDERESSMGVAGAGEWSPPPAVAASIREELYSLSEDARRVTDAAAIAGESFEPGLVAAIAERSANRTLEAFDELIGVDVIRSTAVAHRFRFRHPIVRRVAYDELPPAWRLGAHARAATALRAADAPVTEVALHIERSATGGDPDAIDLLLGAARSVAPRAPLTAGRWLRTALRLLPADADPELRTALLVEAAAALASAGADEESVEEFEQALALLPTDQTEQRAALIARLAEARRRSGQPFEARHLLLDSLESLQSLGKGGLAVSDSVRLELAIDHFWHREFSEIEPLTVPVLAAAEEHNDHSTLALAAALQSLGTSAQLRMPQAVAAMDQAASALHKLTDEELASRVYLGVYIGLAALRLELFDETLSYVRRCLQLARLTGQAKMAHPWLCVTACAQLLRGDILQARRDAAAASDTMLLLEQNWRTPWALEADAMAAFWAGDVARAVASATEMTARSARGGDHFLTPRAAVQLAGALYLTGDAPAALKELQPLDDDVLDMYAGHGWDLLTKVQLALGDVAAAGDLAARAQGRADKSGLPLWRANMRLAHGAALLAAGDNTAATLVREAAEIAETLGNPLLTGRVDLLVGRSSAAGHDREHTVSALRRAETALAAIGAVREADAAARELRRLGERAARRPRPNDGGGLDSLSPREREVARMVAAGRTNRSIAEALFLSEKTIESHLARIYAKLDVHSRAALAVALARSDG